MRRLFFLLSIIVSVVVNAQGFHQLLSKNVVSPPVGGTINLSFTDLSFTADSTRPGGNERWNENSGSQIAPGLARPLSYYRRFFVGDVLNNDGTHKLNGKFRTKMTDAANANGQLFNFRIATLYPGPDLGGFNDVYSYGGFLSVYPQSWHNQMQGEAQPDFNDGEVWIPNYNSASFRSNYQAMWTTVRAWVDTAFIRPTLGDKAGQLIRARDMIGYIDVSGIGSYGEWHHCCLGNGYDVISNWPAGRFPTIATFKQFIDITVNTMSEWLPVIIINVLDAGFFGSGFNNTKIPAEVGIYALEKYNNAGRVGLRRDQAGNDEQYYHMILEQNTMTATINGKTTRADTAIANTYKYGYFVAEPQGSPANYCGANMGCFPGQVRAQRMYSMGNGNYGGSAGVPTGAGLDSLRLGFRLAGARIKLNGGVMTSVLQQNASFNITLQYQNINVATEHRNWTVRYELRSSSNVTVWSGSPDFTINGFNPSASATSVSKDFVLPGSVPAGNYRLVIKIVDPTGYMAPYTLWNVGRETDGAYQMRSIVTVNPGT